MKVNMNYLISRKPFDAGANLCIKATSEALQGASMVAGAIGIAHLSHALDCQIENEPCLDIYAGTHSVTDWTPKLSYSAVYQLAGAAVSFVAAKVLHSAAKSVAAWEVGKKVEVLSAEVATSEVVKKED